MPVKGIYPGQKVTPEKLARAKELRDRALGEAKMPRELALQELKEEYREVARRHGEALQAGRHKEANKAYTRLKRLFGKLRSHPTLALSLLEEMLLDANPSVRLAAATHALALGLHGDAALSTMERLARDPTIGIVRTEAEMGLQVWREKGTFTF